MSRPDDRQTRRSRVQLVLIFLLFLLPPVSAWVAWKYLGEQGVEVTTNAGTLIAPPRPLKIEGLHRADGTVLAEGDFRGRWTYVVFASANCDERCEQQLYLTRQIRLAMSKDVARVQRLLVFAQQPAPALAQHLAEEHADLIWVVRSEQAQALLQQFGGAGFGSAGEQYFLVDPLGNLMMYYDSDIPTRGIMKDLQKLLKISQVG